MSFNKFLPNKKIFRNDGNFSLFIKWLSTNFYQINKFLQSWYFFHYW